ncbi:MAG: hypothetical protein ACYTFY_18470 [Planctomycetota bacterium]|jgi:endonuclease III
MTAKKNQSGEEQIIKAVETLSKIHKKTLTSKLSSIEELVMAVMIDGGAEINEALKGIDAIRKAYVDWNEARVARIAEVARNLDPMDGSDDIAKKMREVLMKVFDRTGRVSFDFMEEMKINEARRALNNIEPVGKVIADRILMQEVPGSTIPFSNEAIAVAKKAKLAPGNANKKTFNKLLDENVSRETALDLFYLLEEHAAKGCTKSKCPLCK